jgi:dual specificity protein kinase YAK1
MTVGLCDLYSEVASISGVEFGYSLEQAPRRVLTKPEVGVANDGCDNSEGNYICRVGDEFSASVGGTLSVVERLGSGTFGQVMECDWQWTEASSMGSALEATELAMPSKVALKIVKNKEQYHQQAASEVKILKLLNDRFGMDDRNGIVRLLDHFEHKGHCCLSMELLNMNLLEVLQRNKYRGLSSIAVATICKQLLQALSCLKLAGVIHSDLKPRT